MQLFDQSSSLLDINPSMGRTFTYFCGVRTTPSKLVSEKNIYDQLNRYHKLKESNFYEWVPDNKQVSFLRMKEGLESSASLIDNTVAIGHMFKKVGDKFTNLFRRSAYLHWYTDAGMDSMEFTEAESNFNDLISEFCFSCSDNWIEDEDYGEEAADD